MCTLVAAGHGDALSHLLARRGIRVKLVPAEVGDLCGGRFARYRRVDGVWDDLNARRDDAGP